MRDAQAMLAHVLDVGGPWVDEGHILTRLHHVRAGIAADRTGSDNRNFPTHNFPPGLADGRSYRVSQIGECRKLRWIGRLTSIPGSVENSTKRAGTTASDKPAGRRKSMRLLRSIVALALCVIFAAPVKAADSYPVRPVKIVVPWPAGGVADFLARIVADGLSQKLGAPFVVDNRAGAGTNIGSEFVAKASPDGYTLLLASSNNAVNMTLYGSMPYDAIKDFAPISLLATVPNILVVNPKLPVRSVGQLIDYANANPGKITYASAGNGSPAHLAAEEFKQLAHIDMLNVPYKGAAPAVTDLIGGYVDVMFTNVPASLGSIESGQLRPIAICSKTRSSALPDLPTVAESGVPNYEAVAWYGLEAPAGTPREIIEILSAAVNEAMKLPEVTQRLVREGTEPVISSPDVLAERIAADIVRYRSLIKTTGIHIE
jgi:tripartite-type tricarboxylate transporter receptor subunit TctC